MALHPRGQSFTLDLTRFAERTKLSLTLIARKITLEVFVKVVLRTPVDTGRARGNWLPSFGAGRDGFDWEKKSPDGQETIAAITALVSKMKAGHVAYLCNSLPYIEALEFGHSQQALHGMARLSVREVAGQYNALGLGILRQTR